MKKTTNGIILAALLLLSACSSCPVVVPGVDVQLQRQDVVVEQGREPTATELGCWNTLPPAPHFEPGPPGSDYLVLPDDQIDAYKSLLAGLKTCDTTWRTWATAVPTK